MSVPHDFELISSNRRSKSRLVWIGILIVAFLLISTILLLPYWRPTEFLSSAKQTALEMYQLTLREQLRNRASTCTEEAREKFIQEANKINDEFQDNFRLSLQTSRIALSPLVAELQRLNRQLKQLPFDACAQIVQTNMSAAYDIAIEGLITFMGKKTTDIDLQGTFMQLQMRHWGAYQIDLSGPTVADDLTRFAAVKDGKQKITDDLLYLQQYSDHKMNCEDVAFLETIMAGISKATTNNFSDLGIGKFLKDVATPTPMPCVSP